MSGGAAWFPRRRWIDVIVAAALAMAVIAAARYRSAFVPDELYQYGIRGHVLTDMWFDADLPRYFCVSTDRLAEQFAVTTEHPLMPLLTYLPVATVEAATGAGHIDSIRWVIAAEAGLLIAACFLLLRMMRCAVFDAAVFAALAAVSAAGLAWSMVANLHLAAALTLMLPLLLAAARARRWPVPDVAYLFASACSLSATITNCIWGILATLLDRRPAAALQITANAFLLVSALWVALSLVFPAQVYFPDRERTGEKAFQTAAPRPAEAVISLIAHTTVMPDIHAYVEPDGSQDLSVQGSWPGSSGALGLAATLLWLLLLAIGVREAARATHVTPFRLLLLALLGGQLALHAVFGRETFLFSIQWLPALIALAAYGSLGPPRRIVRTIACALLVTAAISNWRQIAHAVTLATARIETVKTLPPGTSVIVNCRTWS